MLNRGLDKQELLRIVDSVANEKSIDKELILNSMETAIQRAAYSNLVLKTLLRQLSIEKTELLKFKKSLKLLKMLKTQ